MFGTEMWSTATQSLQNIVTGINAILTQLKAITPSLIIGSGTGTSPVTAGAGGGQAMATPLTAQYNEVGTVVTAADSVLLLPSAVGLIQFVANAGANSMQVFGTGTDTINGVAFGTGVAQAAGANATYFCPAIGKWYRVLGA